MGSRLPRRRHLLASWPQHVRPQHIRPQPRQPKPWPWRRHHRPLIVLLLVAVTLGSPGTMVAAAAVSSVTGPRIPVVLVGGPGGSPARWGVAGGGGLVGALTGAGYRVGTDLFVLHSAADGDPLAAARGSLQPLLQAVQQKTGSPVVDIVTHSGGALTARFYADALAGNGGPLLRQIIMIAPPSRGAGLVDVVRRSALKQGTLSRWGQDRDGPIDDEVDLVRDLTEQIMPLYRRFIGEEWIFAQGPAPAFGDWVGPVDGQVAAWFTTVTPPWGGAAPPGAAGAVPDLGQDLSAVYYGDAALAVTRYIYQQKRPLHEVVLEDWWTGLKPDPDWRIMVLNWLKDRIAKVAVVVAKRQGARLWHRAATDSFEAWAGVAPWAPSLRRLVTEEVQPEAAGAQTGKIPANVWLRHWNENHPPGRALSPRYVYIAGSVLSGAAAAAVDLPEGDGAVAFKDALLPAGPDDLWHGVVGWPGGYHWGLLQAPAVNRHVLSALKWGSVGTVAGTVDSEHPTVKAAAQSMAPIYYDLSSLPGGTLTVDAAPQRTAVVRQALTLNPTAGGGAGPGLWAWLLVMGPGGTSRRIDLGHVPAGGSSTFALAGMLPGPDRVFLGARSQLGGSPRWLPPGSTTGLAAREHAEFTISWQPTGAITPNPGTGSTALPPPGDVPAPVLATTVPAAGAGPGGTVPPSTAAAPTTNAAPSTAAAPTGAAAPRPLVPVIRRSHRITKYHEQARHHARWEWDMGDGTAFELVDPAPAYAQTHTYAAPGEYRVTARSFDPSDQLLREQTWDIKADPAAVAQGDTWSFTAYGPGAPGINAQLTGPTTWITGRPATYQVTATVSPPPFAEVVGVKYDPGPEFDVTWARPGRNFWVRAAVLVDVRYTYPDGRRQTLRHIVLAEQEVEILATSLGGD